MPINQDVTVDFLIRKIGPYVELNPTTGKPRFIKGLNDVWLAVDKFGGISHTAKHFGIQEGFIHEWIDNHYMPVIFAYEISKKLGYSDFEDLQRPTTGYQDSITGFCWPSSWRICCEEFEEFT